MPATRAWRLLFWLGAALCAAPAAAALSVYLSPEELAQRAELIVEGSVTVVASGYDPATGALATYVTLEVERVHRGPADLQRLVIREPGGRYGERVDDLDAVPRYQPGEQVFVFLEARRDGSLRTVGMFFGKYRLDSDTRGGQRAIRELDGQGRILRRPAGLTETLSRTDLVALAAMPRRAPPPAGPRRGGHRVAQREVRRWLPRPAEFDRLVWDRPAVGKTVPARGQDPGEPLELAPAVDPVAQTAPRFTLLSSSDPTRWTTTDSGGAVTVHIDPRNNPLNDSAEAVARLQSAMAAWTAVPESRLVLQSGNTNYDYTGTHPLSPAAAYDGTNIVLFDDPYDDISDPSGCSGVLAIGGYWRSGSTGAPVNNVAYHAAYQLYVIFNNNFECFLGTPDNLAEVAAHELGHGLGFGHSPEPDAIMRAYAYGFRGPRLGDDDRDAAHCTYPHTLSVTRPNGGEVFEVGSLQAIEWGTTAESGPDSGSVDLHYSLDGGQSWQPIVTETDNDGHYDWVVPPLAGAALLVRVSHPNRQPTTPGPFPARCSADVSDGAAQVVAATALAGAVEHLRLERAAAGQLRLAWDASCSPDVVDHVIYEGQLDALRAGVDSLMPLVCSAGADLSEYVVPGNGSRYYLVAPATSTTEGALGSASTGQPRAASTAACLPRETDSTCP